MNNSNKCKLKNIYICTGYGEGCKYFVETTNPFLYEVCKYRTDNKECKSIWARKELRLKIVDKLSKNAERFINNNKSWENKQEDELAKLVKKCQRIITPMSEAVIPDWLKPYITIENGRYFLNIKKKTKKIKQFKIKIELIRQDVSVVAFSVDGSYYITGAGGKGLYERNKNFPLEFNMVAGEDEFELKDGIKIMPQLEEYFRKD